MHTVCERKNFCVEHWISKYLPELGQYDLVISKLQHLLLEMFEDAE